MLQQNKEAIEPLLTQQSLQQTVICFYLKLKIEFLGVTSQFFFLFFVYLFVYF